MSPRTHAVVVQPDQWSGAPAELARLLAPITGTDVAPLTDALARGPMTVEADLSAEDARALAERLAQMGVPAEIQPPANKKRAMPELAAPPSSLQVERTRITDEVPRTRRSTMMGHKPMVTTDIDDDDDDDNAWGAVFPDLAGRGTAAESSAAEEPKQPAAPPSLDDLEAGSTPVPNTESTPPLRLERATASPPPTPAKPTTAPRPTNDTAPPAADVQLANVEPTNDPPPQTPTRRPSKQPLKPDGFDPTRLAALLPEDEAEQPPYKPSGFDPRPEHHPPFATMFAVLAPGAGHVFNGDDDDAMALAFRGWLIVPWARSIGDVRQKAERIRDYWAPRPEEGSGLRAFRFVFAWWLCVALIGATLAWGIPAVVGLFDYEPPPPEGPTAEEIASAFDSARTASLSARVNALGALEKASKDVIPDANYTMTDKERADRLFAIGYLECRSRSHAMCEAMMRRVLELRPAYSPAIKLQTWASVSRNGRPSPMPDIGEVPSLNEIELHKMREEMILEGEEVPPPPEPGELDFAAPAEDAGSGVRDSGHTPEDVGPAP